MSNTIPRSTIKEIVAKYTLENNLKDIYVEGNSDKALIEWFLTCVNRTDVVVYEIQTIDIPNEILDKYSLNHGSDRSRVIALSNELTEILNCIEKVICIADKDFLDYIEQPHCKNKLLKFTDYCTLELYAFCPEVIDKLIKVAIHGLSLNTEQVIKLAINVLKQIFIINLANETLNFKLSKIDFQKDLTLTKNSINFDKNNFIKRYLLTNGKMKEIEKFKKEISRLEEVLSSDPRNFIKGHDLINFFCFLVKKTKKKSYTFNEHDTMSRFLFTSLELCNIEKEPLFESIKSF